MASRAITDLSPAMQELCRLHLVRCTQDPQLAARNAEVILTCTYRSDAEQDKLYAQGRSTPGPIVTKAKGGQSKHNTVTPAGQPAAEAYDVAVLEHGKLVWDDADAWRIVGAHGQAVGLKWYGAPGAKFPEKPHFQNPEA